ncbi:MAG TPA: hypothetical protein VGF84_19600, partial [Micromonosporaceae bacterium]
MDGSTGRQSDASSGFSGALYDAAGRDGAYPVGAPQSPAPQPSFRSPYPPPAASPSGPPAASPSGPPATTSRSGPPAPLDPAAFWSDAASDPWRDPYAAAAIVVSAPAVADEVQPPDFTPRRRSASLGQVLLISVLAALLAGALGGALGYVAAVRGGVSGSTVLGGGGSSAPGLAQRAPTSLAGVVKAVLPSVVTIRVDSTFSSAIGSGFIVTPDGYVI